MDSVSTPCPEAEIQIADALVSLTERLDNIDGRLASIERSIAVAQERNDDMSKRHLDAIKGSMSQGERTIKLSISIFIRSICVSILLLGVTLVANTYEPAYLVATGVFYIGVSAIFIALADRLIERVWKNTMGS